MQGRVAAIGNAAQTLHPVAGQGLNLGLRDAGRLAQTLGAWLPAPIPTGRGAGRLRPRARSTGSSPPASPT
ncbi:FAD-dependent monooxygenase [Achromobacter insuavis]